MGQGKVDEALDLARKALALANEIEDQELIGKAWRVLGQARSGSHDPSIADGAMDAAACFSKSLQILADMGAGFERAHTLREWARHELVYGDSSKGEAMWQEARELYIGLGMESEARQVTSSAP